MIKWLKRSLISLLVLLLLVVSMVAAALFTHVGLKTVLWGAEKALPQLKVANATGALFPSFTLQNLSYHDSALQLQLDSEEVTLAIDAQCLLQPSICVEQLKIKGLTLLLPTLPASTASTENDVSQTPPVTEITTPVDIRLNNIELEAVSLDILGNKVNWQQFTSSLAMQGGTLTLFPTKLQTIDVQLATTNDDAGKDEAIAKDVTANEKTAVEDKAPSNMVLPEVTIPLEVDLQQFDVVDFTLKGASPFVVSQFSISAHAVGQKVNISDLRLNTEQADLSVKTDVTLGQEYPLNLQAEVKVKQPPLNGQNIALSTSGSLTNLTFSSVLSGVAAAKLSGEVQPLNSDLPFSLLLTEGKLQWPLQGDSDYQVDVSEFKGSGSLSGYQLNLETSVAGNAIPNVAVSLAGKGDLTQIELSSLLMQTLGGSVSGQVMANWQSPINWHANLELDNIQPGLQWPQAEGSLSGSLVNSGELLASGGWQVDLPTLDIEGVIRGYPLNVQGNLHAKDPQGKGDISLVTEGLNVKHGPNGITVMGQVDKEWNLDTRIEFPQLSKSIADVKGNIKGSLSLRGELAQPKIVADLAANRLDVKNELQVSKLTLSADLSPLPSPKGKLQLFVKKARIQDQDIQSVDVQLAGTEAKHSLKLAVNSDLLTTSLQVNGGVTKEPKLEWKGALNKGQLSTEQGVWQLDKKVDIRFLVEEQIAHVQAHCWLQADSDICLTEDLTAGKSGVANIEVNHFSFKQIEKFIPKQTQLFGEVNLKSLVRWGAGSKPKVDVSVQLPKGKLIQTIDQPVTVGWQDMAFDARLVDDKLSGEWRINLTDNGDISGQLVIDDVLQKQQKQELNAALVLKNINLDMLKPIAGEYGRIEALINSDIKVSGPIKHPNVNGQLVIDEMVMLGDITPIQVEKGELTVQFNGYQALLDAAINSKDGVLEVNGDANWKDLSAWSSNLKVHAEELKVEVPPMIKAKVSPNMQISLTPTLAKIEGDVYLPWGRISVAELPPSAIGVSSDEIMLNEDYKPQPQSRELPMALETNVNIHVGDDFRLSAFGLTGNLNGQLNVAQKDKGPYVVGEIEIKNGQYSSFGQDLIIKEGKILMNGPVDQPYLAVKAIRNPDNTQDDVIAGIQVTGPVNEPVTTIFSEPAMPQANALSYLLRGQNIDAKSGGNAMTTALISLSLAKSGRVVGKLGEAFGVSDLQLDTAGSGDDSQVTVSGYLTPKLQVQYGVGIFDSFGEFTVRYQLVKDLYLEAVSGVNGAVDLLYQFEFD